MESNIDNNSQLLDMDTIQPIDPNIDIDEEIIKTLSDTLSIMWPDFMSMFGLDNNGIKKAPTCWMYVKKNRCRCTTRQIDSKGETIKNRWHPGVKEREYLHSKKFAK